ncbi:hypothetical protein C8R44DRAFT_894140 [Mycena epipterygia]|nr:hypothetical protein C8R44DRAFT_894140 [Mycena epipterygia]
MKNLLSAMGYLIPEAAVMGGMPSPYGSYAALPAQYRSPYVPGTPPMQVQWAPDSCFDVPPSPPPPPFSLPSLSPIPRFPFHSSFTIL